MTLAALIRVPPVTAQWRRRCGWIICEWGMSGWVMHGLGVDQIGGDSRSCWREVKGKGNDKDKALPFAM
jgi:hypothetical protein